LWVTVQACIGCGTEYSLHDPVLLCRVCGKPLDLQYDLEKIRNSVRKGSLKNRFRSLWRYRELLPTVRDDCIVSLGEGMTPLTTASRYASLIGVGELGLKLDYLNPTGSFKDRGTTVSVSRLRELGVKSVIEDSSGNAGSSLAAYCAGANIGCTFYVPAYTATEKLIQAQVYGAKIVRVPGSRTDVARAAEHVWRETGIHYASHNLSPFFFDGVKTLANEIAEALDWQVPDHIVFPVGGGALMGGTWKGLEELMSLGWINEIPKLHCVQSDACMPIVEAFQNQTESISPALEKETIARGIRISNPASGSQDLKTIKRTGGSPIPVSDREILMHQRLLAKMEGIFVEPTSSAALAGLEKLLERGIISKDESVIVSLTGFGLKDTKSVATEAD